jgi:hypothetical protein
MSENAIKAIEAQTVTVMMTLDQARKCVEQINNLAGEIGKLLLDLYEREGWKALGYKNWRECATAEFKQSQSRLYELLDAAKVERNISDMSEKPTLTKRAVDQLKSLPPECNLLRRDGPVSITAGRNYLGITNSYYRGNARR